VREVTLGLGKWLLAPEWRIVVVWLEEGGGGFGLAVVFGKSKVLDVGKALFSLLGLLVPSSHSNL